LQSIYWWLSISVNKLSLSLSFWKPPIFLGSPKMNAGCGIKKLITNFRGATFRGREATPQRFWISGNEMHNKKRQRQQTNKSQSNCNKWQSDICQVAKGRGRGRLLGKCQLGKSSAISNLQPPGQWYPLQVASPDG